MPTGRSPATRFRAPSFSTRRRPRAALGVPWGLPAPAHRIVSRVLFGSLLLCAFTPGGAQAQDECEPTSLRGPTEVMPAAGASAVLLDAPLRVRFTPDYFASPAAPLPEESLEVRGPDGQPVAGELQLASDDVLFFLPAEGWLPNAVYEGVAFGELDLAFGFRTGASVDTRGATISPLTWLGSTRVEPSCQAPNGGYRLVLTFAVSQDDGAPGSIEYHLYLARAEGLQAPVEVARQRNFTSDPSARVPISFVLDERYAGAPICVQLQVTDSVGNLTVGTPSCLDPVEGANFAGLCVVRAGRAASSSTVLLGCVAFALFMRRGRRRVGARRTAG